jgi:hypothetical protein
MVSSLDGVIAKKDNSVSWLDSSGDVYEKGVSDGNADVVTSIDCFVLGSRTYEHALQLGWPYGDTPAVVITNRELPSTRKSVEFYSGDVKKLVDEILALRYGNIWLALAVEDRVHRPVALLRSAWDHLIPLFCYTDTDGTARYRRSSRWQPGFGQGGDVPAGIERGCGAGPAQSRAPDCRGTRFPRRFRPARHDAPRRP